MSFTFDTHYNNSALPYLPRLDQLLLADSALTHWFQPDSDHVSATGALIDYFSNLKGGAAIFSNDGNATWRATLTEGEIGSFQAAVFDGATDRYAYRNAAEPDFTQPFSIAGLIKPAADMAERGYVVSKFTSTANQMTAVSVNTTGTVQFRHGDATITDVAPITGQWRFYIASSDGTTARLRVDGVAIGSAATNNVTGTTFGLAFGAQSTPSAPNRFKGSIADHLIYNADILATGNEARVALVENLFVNLYGLPFTPPELVL